MSLDTLEDALNNFSSLQKDVLDIERAMDRAIASMDRFKESFEKYLRIEDGYVKGVISRDPGEAYYRLDNMYGELEKIWRQMAKYEKHLNDMGYKGFSKDLKIEMSGLAALMNRIQEYKNKLR